jgi:hypothetical protein
VGSFLVLGSCDLFIRTPILFLKNKNQQIMEKQLEKIMAIMDKLTDRECVQLWQDVGDKIHQRIDAHRRESEELQSKVPKK